jgi:predicted enzyme related to lactoylglutathione lyase
LVGGQWHCFGCSFNDFKETLMAQDKIGYVELPSSDVARLKSFYGQLFGWRFHDFGDDYAAVDGSGVEGGFNGDPASRSKAPLIMIESADTQARVLQAGGSISVPIFAYPGGRRFHFFDPSGNELAVFQPGR